MSDFPAGSRPPLALYSFGGMAMLRDAMFVGKLTAGTSGTYSNTNRIAYIPFAIPWPFLVKRWAWGNGSATGGTIDVGVYTAGGTLIASAGSTGQSGSSNLQTVDLATPLMLSPGSYYMAFQVNGTTNRIWNCAGTVQQMRACGAVYQDVAGIGLSTYATSMSPNGGWSGTAIPLFGMVRW